jgi:hypothetical protein
MNNEMSDDDATLLDIAAHDGGGDAPVTVRDIGGDVAARREQRGLVHIRWTDRVLGRGTVVLSLEGCDAVDAIRRARGL